MAENKEKEKAKAKADGFEKKDFVEIKGKFFVNYYFNQRLNKDVMEEVIEIKHPFDINEENIKLTIKDNARRGRFGIRARKYLAENNLTEFEITGKVELRTFQDKKTRKQKDYAGIEINNNFDDGVLYCNIRDEAVRAVFTDFAREHLKLKESN